MLTFGLSSDHCELLLAFEETGSLSALATLVGRDISVVSRQLQKIAQTLPVLEKIQGKWRLTPLGRQVNQWTRNSVETQKRLLQQRTAIRIASTREFTARVIAPNLSQLFPRDRENTHVYLVASEEGVEKLLLSGDADFGFDCGRPNDPLIRFKSVKSEAFVVVASKKFLAKHPAKTNEELIQLPHLQYARASTSGLLQLSHEMPLIKATFNDIASVREACMAGLGWAVLPKYAVQRELDLGLLTVLPFIKIKNETFGVWWSKERSSIAPWIETATNWLKLQSL